MTTEQHNLLKKLYALSTQGVDGERENARSMFENLCSKLNIDPQQFDPKPLKMCEFKYNKKFMNEKFINQVMASVVGNRDKYGSNRVKNAIFMECTKEEEAEIRSRINFYESKLYDHFDKAYRAFIQANKLYRKPDPNEKSDSAPLTLDERARMMEILEMAAATKREAYLKQIES